MSETKAGYSLWVIAGMGVIIVCILLVIIIKVWQQRALRRRMVVNGKERVRISKTRDNRESEQRDGDEAELKALAARACSLKSELLSMEADEEYRKLFLQFYKVYQVFFGLRRRAESEGMSDDAYLTEMDIAISNFSLSNQLNAGGFIAKVHLVSFDRDVEIKRLLAMDCDSLRETVEQRERLLASYSGILLAKNLLVSTGPTLYQLIESAKTRVVERCLQLTREIQESFVSYGCVPIFADDPRVMQSETMQLSYQDDTSYATELPALCTKQGDNYVLLGGCIGTRRT